MFARPVSPPGRCPAISTDGGHRDPRPRRGGRWFLCLDVHVTEASNNGHSVSRFRRPAVRAPGPAGRPPPPHRGPGWADFHRSSHRVFSWAWKFSWRKADDQEKSTVIEYIARVGPCEEIKPQRKGETETFRAEPGEEPEGPVGRHGEAGHSHRGRRAPGPRLPPCRCLLAWGHLPREGLLPAFTCYMRGISMETKRKQRRLRSPVARGRRFGKPSGCRSPASLDGAGRTGCGDCAAFLAWVWAVPPAAPGAPVSPLGGARHGRHERCPDVTEVRVNRPAPVGGVCGKGQFRPQGCPVRGWEEAGGCGGLTGTERQGRSPTGGGHTWHPAGLCGSFHGHTDVPPTRAPFSLKVIKVSHVHLQSRLVSEGGRTPLECSEDGDWSAVAGLELSLGISDSTLKASGG